MKAISDKSHLTDETLKNERTRQSLAAVERGKVFDDDEVSDFLDSLDSEDPLPVPLEVKLSQER